MDESIFNAIKKALGLTEDYTAYDNTVLFDINSVFSILTQLNVGPKEGFQIEDDTAVWTDYVTDTKLLNIIKPYVAAKVHLMFDTPQSSAVTEVLKETCREYESRILYFTDGGFNE